jgi:hypothetical protein
MGAECGKVNGFDDALELLNVAARLRDREPSKAKDQTDGMDHKAN